MNTFLQDLRYAARVLFKQPGFTLIAVFALALGIGANTAIFSVVSAVLLRPLPYPEPDRLMAVWTRETKRPDSQMIMSYPDIADLKAGNTVLEKFSVYDTTDSTLTERGREAVHVQSAQVSADLFSTLGVNPALGRSFLPKEDEPGSRVVIISHGLWQRRFGGDKEVLSRSLTIDGQNCEVVGVMPPGFRFPVQNEPVELWTTIAQLRESPPDGSESQAAQRGNHFLHAIARLKPGVSAEQAEANLSAIAASLSKQYPETNLRYDGSRVRPLLADLTRDVKPALMILFGAAGCVLLIACVNVANLLLARATTRQKEIGIRTALGAGRARIVRQLLTESLLLALLGGAVGALLALWGTEGVAALLPESFPRAGEIRPDARVLLFTAAVSLLTGVLFGLAPSWRVSRPNLASSLNEAGGRGSTESLRGRQLRGALVVAEMVLAFVLLVGAGLLIRSFWRLQGVPPGFEARGVLTAEIALPEGVDPTIPARNASFYKRLLERAAALPNVESISAINPLPLSGRNQATGVDIAGRPTPKGERLISMVRSVAPNYFRTMGISLKSGRDFDARDTYEARGVVIVSETLARQFFPGENPLGKLITPQVSYDTRDPIEREIIGVVGDVKSRRLSSEDRPELYLPHPQYSAGGMTLVVRAGNGSNPLALLPSLRAAVAELDKDLPLYKPRTMEQYVAASVAQPRLNMMLIAIFAGVAALLTAIGIYGVMAYSVAQRTQEIGIRMALGAQRPDVLRLILGQGLKLTVLGVLIGVAAAWMLTRLLASLLYGVGAMDASTLGAVMLLLAVVGLLACWLPARRAAGVNPMVALRDE